MRTDRILFLLAIAGFGAYRAFQHGTGKKRWWFAVPIALVLLGGVLAPFLLGVMQAAGAKPSMAGIGGGELVILVVVGSPLLALVSGVVLSLSFRPRSRRRRCRAEDDE